MLEGIFQLLQKKNPRYIQPGGLSCVLETKELLDTLPLFNQVDMLQPIITNRVHKAAVSASGHPMRDGGSAKLVLGLGEEGGKSVSRGYFRQELHQLSRGKKN